MTGQIGLELKSTRPSTDNSLSIGLSHLPVSWQLVGHCESFPVIIKSLGCMGVQMYSFHRLAHSNRWLYRIAHKDHHVVMDFPLGPHAPALEKLAHYTASIIASFIVGISAGSWVLNLNILMTQCVLEHAYSSFTIPYWHSLFCFNTADLHQTHHTHNNSNFGYAFNIFDPIFGTLSNTFQAPPEVIGPATPVRVRAINRMSRAL